MSTFDDEIVEEIRRRREAHAESFGYDLNRITEDLQRQERESGTSVVTRAPRTPREMLKRASAYNPFHLPPGRRR